MRIASLFLVLSLSAVSLADEKDWKQTLKAELPRMGHRNWIVIADSAYPLQSGAGIETITTRANHLEVVKTVFEMLEKSNHIRPVIHLDSELPFVPETDAKGIGAFRQELKTLLKDKKVESLPHEDIITKLDKAGKTFKVLIIKTPLAIPYTSLFLELDCGYWGPESEMKLREAIKAKGK